MSIDMYVSKSKAQATSMSQVCQQHLEGYEALQKAISQFTLEPFLKGKAYDSAKAYYSAVLYPLVQGGILLTEATKEAIKKFPERYQSEVDSGDLKQSELEEQIRQADNLINQANALQKQVMQSPLPETDQQLQLKLNQALIDVYQTSKKELEEKLQKLVAFHASSPSIFSEIASLKQAIDQGIAQTKTAWNPITGTFVVPSQEKLAWVTTIRDFQKKKEVAEKDDIQIKEIKTTHGTFYQVLRNGEVDQEATSKLAGEIAKKDLRSVKAFLAGAGMAVIENNGVKAMLDGIFGEKTVDASLQNENSYQAGALTGNIISLAQAGLEYIGGGLWGLGTSAASIAGAPATGGASLSGVPALGIAGTAAIWGHATAVGGMTVQNIMGGNYGGSEIKNTYNGIKDSPKYPEGFKGRKDGTTTNKIKNKETLSALRKVEPGEWKKVYKDGFDKNGNRISIHYFQSKSGKVFDVKVKTGWSN
ncbi:T7SS effector LXG polymorphic toxin [Listeria kieliensis]